jgi:hypothetical protein
MKHFKLSIIVLLFSLFIFSSCKDESVDTQKDAIESVAAKSSMQALKTHFNSDGSLARDGQNPTDNIIFDFCFDFVYPITLSYNTGTEVTVQDVDGLVDILVNMTDDLYINGIAFPFQVEVFNADTDSFEVVTIQDEATFMQLLTSCSIDDSGQEEDCNCIDEYAPVCVSVLDAEGNSFTIDFPNMCYAQCEGFTQSDIVDCDFSNPADGDYFDDCFDLVYPFSIVTPEGETIQINDEDEFETALYTNYYFDFVYPFSIETEVNGEDQTVTINNEEELTNLLMQCSGDDSDCNCPDEYNPVCVSDPVSNEIVTYDNECEAICDGYTQQDFVDCNGNGGGDCDISNLTVSVGDCISTTAYSITVDFDITNYDGDTFFIMFNDGTTPLSYSVSDLPVTIDVDVDPATETASLAVATPNNTCEEDVEWEIPNCQ